jgi:hypothetical protein
MTTTMSPTAASRHECGQTGGRQFAAMGALARVEGYRLIRHPAYLMAGGYLLFAGGIESIDALRGVSQINKHNTAELLVILFGLFLPLLAVFPASLVATSARRAGADEMLAASPVSERQRVGALLLASLVPATIGSSAVLIAWLLDHGVNEDTHSALTFLGTPFLYLGVGALALAAARWLPWPGVAVGLLVGLWVWVVSVVYVHSAFVVLTAPYLIISDTAKNPAINGYSDIWHTVYLAGLVALAAIAALYRDELRRMFAIGIPVGLATLAVAVVQLP